jgi:hypothetical protein
LVDLLALLGERVIGGDRLAGAGVEPDRGPILGPAALGVDVAMTTNGATLRGMAKHLRTAGLTRVNISLDSLDRARFERMTRRDELDNVLDGIEAAKEAGFDPVKINAVVERGVNDDEIVDLATFGRERDVEVRFIEFMPLDAPGSWVRDKVNPGRDRRCDLGRVSARAGAGEEPPRDRWLYADGRGDVGVIPVSRSLLVAIATASASPPRASSARACSRPGSSTFGASCVAGGPTTTSRQRSCGPSERSGPATRSVRSRSSARTAA